MVEKSILFVDNDPTALQLSAEYLGQANYRVYTARSAEEATHILHTRHIHLAIVDLRLIKEGDEYDQSGLLWAQEITRALPKIIYTKFPTIEIVRKALVLDVMGIPSVIDVVDKRDGLPRLLEAVKAGIDQHVRINWQLDLNWNHADRFGLLNVIDRGLEGDARPYRAEELQDLFRRLFSNSQQLQIGHLLWQRDGRAAVAVFPFSDGQQSDPMVVVCGAASLIADEAQRFEKLAPRAPGDYGTGSAGHIESVHYAALAYSLAGADLESVESLVKIYQTSDIRVFDNAIQVLFQRTLAAWHQNRLEHSGARLVDLYCERMRLGTDLLSLANLESRLTAIGQLVPVLRAKFEFPSRKFIVRFDSQTYDYPDPMYGLPPSFEAKMGTLVIRSPGTLTGDNILTDEIGRAWITDFADAGRAPEFWHYVALEAAIRFDWIAIKELRWLHEFEATLTDQQFARLDTKHVEPQLRRPLRAIRAIRHLAGELIARQGVAPYYAGMYYQAMGRLAIFDPSTPLTLYQLARLAHVLMAAGILASWFRSNNESSSTPALELRLDAEMRRVIVGSQTVELSDQAFALLSYLYSHAGKVCTRADIIREVFRVELDESEDNRLNMAIHRLRQRVETDPQNPRYICSVSGGYSFNTHPDSPLIS